LSDTQTAQASFVAESEGRYYFAVDVSDEQYTITAVTVAIVGMGDLMGEMLGAALMTELRVYDAPEEGNRLDDGGTLSSGEPCWMELSNPLLDQAMESAPEDEVSDIPLFTSRILLPPEACEVVLEDHRQIQGGLRGYVLGEFMFDNDAVFDLFQDDFGTGTMYDDRFVDPSRAEPGGASLDDFGAGG
jgi:hypothetical protein